jgi:2-C-methyl-D-erythritol 4-phosphate cytidylyltransferase
VVPAAGIGCRFAADSPKQYQVIAGRAVLGWSLAALLGVARLRGVSVAISGDDGRFSTVAETQEARVRSCLGGASRQASVRAALEDLLAAGAKRDDGVLVHDAARPGLTPELIETLVETVGDDPNGGLLVMPVGDTVKQGEVGGSVEATLPRDRLWLAQTPQYFRLGLLKDALDQAHRAGVSVTDEASAMEALGYRPRLVTGSQRNLKLTHATDRLVLEALLGDEPGQGG